MTAIRIELRIPIPVLFKDLIRLTFCLHRIGLLTSIGNEIIAGYYQFGLRSRLEIRNRL